MISEIEWIYKAERRVTMALDETVKQLDYEANALWKGKRICGETQLGATRSPYDGLIHRVKIGYHEDRYDGICISVAFYAMVTFPLGTVEMYVHDPCFPDEATP
jgi:hypothetical protein